MKISRWSRGLTQLNPAMVLRSHIRASARTEEIIADQRTVSNSFNRWIRSFVESSSAFASLFRVGSDMNRLIIFLGFGECGRWSFNEWRVLSLGILDEMCEVQLVKTLM